MLRKLLINYRHVKFANPTTKVQSFCFRTIPTPTTGWYRSHELWFSEHRTVAARSWNLTGFYYLLHSFLSFPFISFPSFIHFDPLRARRARNYNPLRYIYLCILSCTMCITETLPSAISTTFDQKQHSELYTQPTLTNITQLACTVLP
jgi:hypothetical protein